VPMFVVAGNGAEPNGPLVDLALRATGKSVSDVLHLDVQPTKLPTMEPASVHLKAGQKKTIKINADTVISELANPVFKILSVTALNGAPAGFVQKADTELTLAPTKDGVFRYDVSVSDVGDTDRTDRQAQAVIELNVIDLPDAPEAPRWDPNSLFSKTVELSWNKPNDHRATIRGYRVSWDGGHHQLCPGTSCSIKVADNNHPYHFTVAARNSVGWSKESRATRAVADAPPTDITNPTVVRRRHGTVTISWSKPLTPDGQSKPKFYQVRWNGGSNPKVTSTSLPLPGDDGVDLNPEVRAVNAAGNGPWTGGFDQAMASGHPDVPGAPTVNPTDAIDHKDVIVSWGAVVPQGVGPTEYQVLRTGDDGSNDTVCPWQQDTSCTRSVDNNGAIYTYKVQARNQDAVPDPSGDHESAPSAGTDLDASSAPSDPSVSGIQPTKTDNTATITFTTYEAHGKNNYVFCRYNGNSCGGPWTEPPHGSTDTQTVSGLPDGTSVNVQLVSCSHPTFPDPGYCSGAVDSPSVTTYGPIPKPDIIATNGTGSSVNWSVTVYPNGRPIQVVVKRNGEDVRVNVTLETRR